MYSIKEIELIIEAKYGDIPPEAKAMIANAISEFADEIAKMERDACAKIAERMGYEGDFDDEGSRIAKAIRDRNA